MNAKPNVPGWILFILFVFVTLFPLTSHAQCYLSQECAPQDNLTYLPNGTGQVYHGDGASSNWFGGWSTGYSDVNQCLSCHYGTDTLPYLMTGHKNTLRKIAPKVVWGGPDGSLYPTTDANYGSGSIFDWKAGQATLGWCNPLSTPALNGLIALDSACLYPTTLCPMPMHRLPTLRLRQPCKLAGSEISFISMADGRTTAAAPIQRALT